MLKALITAVAILTLAACASVPVAPERIQASEQAIQDSISAGAEREASATKYLELARGELADGKKLSASGETAHAEKVLDRADADAKLAAATAREGAAKAQVKQSSEALKDIR